MPAAKYFITDPIWTCVTVLRQSNRLLLQFIAGSKASIFVEKHCRSFPVRSKSVSFLSSQIGPAFFDEDDVCAGSLTHAQPVSYSQS